MSTSETDWKKLFKIGGITAWVFVIYSFITMAQLILFGGQPENALEAFTMLAENKLIGFLRLDIPTLLIVPLYYVIFLCIFIITAQCQTTDGSFAAKKCAKRLQNWPTTAQIRPQNTAKSSTLRCNIIGLWKTDPALATLGSTLAFAGVTLFLATPSAFSWIHLNEKYLAATSVAEKNQLIAAGEALLASDMWHGSGAIIGGLLILIASLILSILMLKSGTFCKATAIVGIVTYALDLAHALVGFIFPQAGVILMAIAGPLYLVWFPLLGRDLFRMSRD